jgi:hypothetical protein
VSHSRKSAAQRAKSLERLKAFREVRKVEAPAAPPPQAVPANAPPPPPPAPPPAGPFDNYEVIRTIESTEWREGDRYPRFLLAYCSAGSRLSHSRNQPNPTDI